jgi:hypothetical protein
METDQIKRIEIDEDGRLHIYPLKSKFPMIYRTATEVHWNPERKSLYSPTPREWTYFEWYKHIVNVVEEGGLYSFQITEVTQWINIPDDLKNEIKKERMPKHNWN